MTVGVMIRAMRCIISMFLPYPANAESLWRDDHSYNIVVIVGYNDDPPIPGKGSAIFLHVVREGYSPTVGCVAFSLLDLREIISTVPRGVNINIL